MNKKFMKLSAGVLSLAMVFSSFVTNVKALEKEEQANALKIGVLSDTHYFSKDLYSNCEDFTTAMNSDRKMLKESSAILESTLEAIVEDAPDVVMIAGDLTKDGEEVNHRAMAEKLKETKKKLPDTQFYVINGNHDINNPHGKDFSSGEAKDADTTTVEEFRSIYEDFGYGNNTKQYKPNSTDAGSLSYVAHPAEGYTLIAVDSCKYSADQTASGEDSQETGGVIGQDLLNWVRDEASNAKANGDVVLVLEHHGVVPHFSQEPTVMKDYLVDNYQEVSETFANAGVSYVFTGHMHANDIAEYTSANGNKLYDIETGSLVTYPSLFRSVTIQAGTEKTQDGNSLVSEMRRPNTVNYKDFDTGEVKVIDDLTEYAKSLTLSKEVICTMINEGVLTPTIDSVVESDGLKALVAQLLQVAPEQVAPTITTALTQMLPQTKEEGLPLTIAGFNFLVYYSADEQAIKLDQNKNATRSQTEEGVLTIPTKDGSVVKFIIPQDIQSFITEKTEGKEIVDALGLFDPISLKVPNQKLSTCIDNLFTQVTNDFLGTGSVQTIVEAFVGQLLDSKVDDTHTVFNVVETVYQMHLAGNEQADQWLVDAIGKIKAGEMLPKIIKQSITDTQPILSEQTKKIKISLKGLVEKGNDSIATGAAVAVVQGITLDGSTLVDSIENMGELIPNELLTPVNDIAYNVAESMSHDDNYQQDLDTTILIEGEKEWDTKPIPDENKPAPEGNKPAPEEDKQSTPNTGDSTPVLFTIAAGIVSAFVLIELKNKKQKLNAK